ncbi:hypothetical protein C900_03442 [Fulvivirga imtechensis AK7]|uniref:SbsA Ig-like domain-containing protein n=1 Tax=Fulvivirga imtechensis AK7 TaxID=1237149 RepID=L8JT53_9BACT|nr:Ig-like domain-containing protein [Fulvivirga imtechensis]ELR70669.1 hypothetical protein C900_03442 [Fulvivirga imtechensis AK7]
MYRIPCIIACFVLALLYSCANQVAPTGGPKDETPPQLMTSVPKQGQLNFKGDEIVLEFDELVRTDNAKEQFIITPRPTQEYQIKYRKNKVIIQFDKPLEDSTTYSINFREGIKDLTEGNAADTLRLAFSTGHFLDSLSISGKVKNLLSGSPASDVMVALYKANDTLDIFNSPPVYLTKTYADGSYLFENLKNGIYNIYAVSDKNKNLTLDSKTEKHGFLAEPIQLDTSVTNIDIPIHFLDVREFTLQNARQSGTTFNIKYNKYVTDYKLILPDTTTLTYNNFADDTHTSIQLFKPIDYQDSILFYIQASDSIETVAVDTLYAKFEPTQRSPVSFTTSTDLKRIVTKTPVIKAEIKFNKPVRSVNPDSLYIYLDSANVIFMTQENSTWNTTGDILSINQAISPDLFVTKTENQSVPSQFQKPQGVGKITTPEESSPDTKTDTTRSPTVSVPPHLYMGQGAFISAESDTSKIFSKDLSFVQPNQLGVILVEIQTEVTNYIVQLLSKNTVVAENINGKAFEFKNIEPGEYRIRVLIDSDNNGKWDIGNIKANKEPEPVIFYENSEGNQTVTLRANWEVGPHVISF